MFMRQNYYLMLVYLMFLTVGCATVKHSKLKHISATPSFEKIMVIFYENESFSTTESNEFFKKLAERGALLTNFHGERHPSQPNYIAFVSGSNQGIEDDNNHDISAKHIGDLLESKGKTWKNYSEGYPGDCYTGAKTGRYVRKHTPFFSFTNVQKNPERCANVVPATELKKDIAKGAIPDFSIYTPDLDNDGHDTGIEGAATAFKKTFESLINDPDFMKGMLLVITFDEDDKKERNRIYTALIGDGVMAGSSTDADLNHYSLLKLIEDRWGLGNLGKNDVDAAPITGIWT